MGRSSGTAWQVGWLVGCAIACLAGCASISGLDGIEECSTCFDDGGSSQDGTVPADAAGDASSGADTSPDTFTADTGAGDSDPLRDASAGDAPDTQPDGASNDGGGVDSNADAAPPGDGASDATPPGDAPADVAESGPSCNPSTCVGGCCQGINCIAGTQDTACGQTGAACLNCASLGDTCVGGACLAPSSNCPTTCSGCCDTNNACHATYSAQFCPTSDGGTFKAGLGCENCAAEGDPFCVHDFVVYICSPIP